MGQGKWISRECKRQRRTLLYYELELLQLLQNLIRVQLLRRELHSDVFDPREISLEGVIQPVLELDEFRDLEVDVNV